MREDRDDSERAVAGVARRDEAVSDAVRAGRVGSRHTDRKSTLVSGGGTLERARRGANGTPPISGEALASLRRLNAAALNAAEALVRENRLAHHSRNSENHLTYAEALRQSGYTGDNGVVV